MNSLPGNIEYWERIEQFYLKKLDKDSTDVIKNHIGLAAVYEIMHRFEDCFLHCGKVLELSKNNFDKAEAHVLMGRVHKSKKEFTIAINHFLKAISISPECDAAIEDAGNCYMNLKDFSNAEIQFRKLERFEDCADIAQLGLGDLYYEIKDYDRSIAFYEKYIDSSDINEIKFGGLLGIARCLAAKRLFKESISVFKQLAEQRPADALLQFYIGLSYQNADDQYMAMHYYMQALEMDPDFPEVYNNIGKLYADFDGDIKAAIHYLEKAVAITDNDQLLRMLYINLAYLNQQIADYDKSEYYKDKSEEF